MFKSPRRNGRNKGFKIKHVIQVSMLLGVSIWLLYQIHHHSDDKKPAVTTKISHKLDNDSSNDISKFGRKVLRPKVKGTKTDDEQNNEIQGLEDVEDREREEHVEVVENEHADSKEESEVIKEHENVDDDDKGHEGTGKVQTKRSEDGNRRNEQDKAVVMEDNQDTQKEISPNLKEGDMSVPSEDNDDDDQKGEVENDKMMNNEENESGENDTSSRKQPSVDRNTYNLKEQTAQQIDSAPDSYETNAAGYMKSTGNDRNMEADSDSASEVYSKNGESEQKDDVSTLEEEKDALTDLESLAESGTGGSVNRENADTK